MTNHSTGPKRGRGMTRLEVFTDAAFAFAAAMLAISIDEIPANYPELIEALKGAPAFAASFAILLVYWRGHQNWSQRYGLEDLPAVLLTALLILVLMIYVYPLRILFGAAFHVVSGGWLPSGFALESLHQFRVVLSIYGIGFAALSGTIAALYAHAWKRRDALGLDPRERFDAIVEFVSWSLVALFGLASFGLAWLLPDRLVPLAAWMYCLLIPYGPTVDWLVARIARRRFGAGRDERPAATASKGRD